ncbi:MAG: FAD-binding protein [Oscillospiraceae bacterium]|uniref:FAD-dependent oxidoreductase n=1 Tax=Gemmiger formicilis TaxID=745368 RepID=UPI0022E8B5BC|nr:FAD-binding protein [Gemmiger formicilis]UYI80980.1 MAG: FAD-binding protein [Oscillospiraceae bacterium]
MEHEIFTTGAYTAKVYRCNTAVVGSGAAGFNAADRLWQLGQHDIVLVTENRAGGTSRNTGSDKQTYYKLTLSGGEPDSVREMADTLFAGRCVDGDLALCEAALSSQCFLKLVELGVPFPRNRYGEYIGYKTDHDPRRRATSVGPYTSKQMTECLEAAVQAKGVPMLDKTQVIKILTNGGTVCGLLCLNVTAQNDADRFVLIRCKNVIWATGGPAGMYADSVYPFSQYGATGLALEAGAKGKNLTEWQYGLASVAPRWNVSGTYMQVLPRVYSAAADGSDEREFLMDFFTDAHDMLSKLFLKGYQWPFDVRKVAGGSSIIDILVYLETCKGRKVYLDYRTNPADGEFSYDDLLPEAHEYLTRAGACFGTPIERLAHMNQPAIDFYRDKGVDLYTQPLEIALCAQHNNGGIGIDCWWQTDVKGLFAVGEAAASHGVYRPGGTALNAGQVGSTRAAQYIAARCRGDASAGFDVAASAALAEMAALADACRADTGNVRALWQHAAEEMSRCGAAIRDPAQIRAYGKQVEAQLAGYAKTVKAGSRTELAMVYRLRDMLLSQHAYLTAMADYTAHGGKSRGSALYTDLTGGIKPFTQLPDTFTFALDEAEAPLIQELWFEDGTCRTRWRAPRPIPEDDDFFENVWRSYRETGNIY